MAKKVIDSTGKATNEFAWTMVGVISSNLKSAGYKPATKTLRILFQNGGVYQYSPITREEYMSLIKAESVGKFFNENIKDNTDLTVVKEESK